MEMQTKKDYDEKGRDPRRTFGGAARLGAEDVRETPRLDKKWSKTGKARIGVGE